MRRFLSLSTATLLATSTLTSADYYGIDPNAVAAYFNYEEDYVFAANPTANGDIYFHMSSPDVNSWIGGGFGSGMKDSFMLIAYRSADGYNLTLSARVGTGHTEPRCIPEIEIQKVTNDSYAPYPDIISPTGAMIAHAVCKNCTQWVPGAIDLNSANQEMIFALGPVGKHVEDDSVCAGIPQHRFYGQYTMDMTKAVNYTGWYGRVPAPNVPDFAFPPTDVAFVADWTSPPYNAKSLSNSLPTLHAALMCVAFVFIFPLGSLILLLLKRVLVHAALQVLGLACVLGGFGVATTFAGKYNKSRDYKSTHQLLGLFVIAGLLLQLGLGLINHVLYIRSRKPSPFGVIHMFLGPTLMILGLVNAGIGFDFAWSPHINVVYGISVAVMFVLFIGILSCLICFKQRRKYRPEVDTPLYPNSYQDYEMPGGPFSIGPKSAASYGERPPEPYAPAGGYAYVVPPPLYIDPSLVEPIMYSSSSAAAGEEGEREGGESAATTAVERDSPYTPTQAYTPYTPRTWKKEDVTRTAEEGFKYKDSPAGEDGRPGGERWG